MSRISEIAKEMKTWWGNDGSDIEVQNALDEIIRLDEATDRKTEPSSSEIPNSSTISKMEQVETMSCQECKRWIYDDRWGWFCPLKSQDECKYEPKGLEQFRVGLEYHTDTTHFGKVKGESITTNKVEDEPQAEREGE